jgi:hypothetical protein
MPEPVDMQCKKPGCSGGIFHGVSNKKNVLICQGCGTVYTKRGKIMLADTDWTPKPTDCTPAYCKNRQIGMARVDRAVRLWAAA